MEQEVAVEAIHPQVQRVVAEEVVLDFSFSVFPHHKCKAL
jgi:hypothetical protein